MNQDPKVGEKQIEELMRRSMRANMNMMTLHAFQREYEAPFPTPNQAAVKLWASYQVLAERYDRTLTDRRDQYGNAMLVTTWERAQSSRYAFAVRQRVLQAAQADGHDDEEVKEAENIVKSWSYNQCEGYTTLHGLDQELEPTDGQADNSLAGMATAYRHHGRRRNPCLPDSVFL